MLWGVALVASKCLPEGAVLWAPRHAAGCAEALAQGGCGTRRVVRGAVEALRLTAEGKVPTVAAMWAAKPGQKRPRRSQRARNGQAYDLPAFGLGGRTPQDTGF